MSNRLAHVVDAKWRSEDVNINEERDFSFLRLDERILAGLSNAGYRIPSPIQLKAIPLCLSGGDVFVQGKAGTGKTLIVSILAVAAVLEAKDLQVLIVAPTREGAFEICNTIHAIGFQVKDLNCECFIGGFSFADDILKASECKIAVGTLGRIMHLIDDERLKVDTINLFILDDFDELLHMRMKPEIYDIFHILPDKIQTVVTSLTCTDEVMKLTSIYLKPHFQACFNESELSVLDMAHYYYIVPVNYMHLLSYRRKLEILEVVLCKVKFSQCIIYCNSVFRIELLSVDIQKWGLSVASISKAKKQVDRLQAVERLKKNRYKVIVSTDVSSRGLDAENVDLVINFDMPVDSHIYLRRCGRAGRYGAKCSCVTFLTEDQIDKFAEIENEHFNSYVLPDPIPEDLNSERDINPNITKGNSISSLTEFNKKPIINLKKMKAREDYSRLTVNENEETRLDGVDEDFSVVNVHKSEDQTIDLEIVTTNHFMENYQDIRKIKPNETCLPLSYKKNEELLHGSEIFSTHHPLDFENTEVFNEECESKKCELSSCETTLPPFKADMECAKNDTFGLSYFEPLDFENTEVFNEECELSSCETKLPLYKTEAGVECATNDAFNLSDFEILSDISEIFDSSNNHSKDCTVVSSESKSLPLNDNLESLITSGRETLEIESIQHLKKNDSGNEDSLFGEIDLGSTIKTVSKSSLEIKSTSKTSKDMHVLHTAFNKMHLEREQNRSISVPKYPQVTRNKKNFYADARNIRNKKSVKSLDHCKSRSKSHERQVMYCGLKTTSSEFVVNQPCTKFNFCHSANHMDKKKVNKNLKIQSTCGKFLTGYDRPSQTHCYNVKRNFCPHKKIIDADCCNCHQLQPTYCNLNPCHAPSQYCHFSSNYCQPPFLMPGDDLFYKQWMFINNFSYFQSYYLK